jgi:hypothetical protein
MIEKESFKSNYVGIFSFVCYKDYKIVVIFGTFGWKKKKKSEREKEREREKENIKVNDID